MQVESSRPSHAILDSGSRAAKAAKIAKLAGVEANSDKRVLEIGCGSGYIANYFSRMGFGMSGTFATDVTDERQIADGYNFRLVRDTTLPFPDNHFDLIVTNHVIEHVGEVDDQITHLTEAHRCLKPGGVLYLAVPNKWRLFEAHYRLPLLSWLPRRLADLYVRLRGVRHGYDCRPLSRREAIALLKGAKFGIAEKTIDAIALVSTGEDVTVYRFARFIPQSVFEIFRFIVPTLIFVGKKRQ